MLGPSSSLAPTVFTITRQLDQYLTYHLEDQHSGSRLSVVPERGGIISQWQVQGQEILYLDTQRFQDPNLSVRGGIPLLFPICGNLPNDQYQLDGQAYALKQHGFARNLPWQVLEQNMTEAASLTLGLRSTPETLALYPFAFELRFTYQLRGNSLRIHQQYTNHSPQIMPFSTGLHPYFQVADKHQLQFDIPAQAYQDQQTKTNHPYQGNFNWQRAEMDFAFTPISQLTTGFQDRARGLQIRLDFSEHFSTLVFWTLKDKDYICLEPWSAPRNALNTGEQLTHLAPHSTLEAWVEIQVETLAQ
ncbi:aldose epimerase [Synechocystis sp. LKSZ1]|uniref:aldose epimerase family protein n=1 Tax=Synechocystis sp. LKSZ1 TaxID=3144951 RepID=UPI00336BE455